MTTAALALFAALALSPNDVWIVDVEGEGDHLDIQSAIDAAADGDTIFIVDPREPGHVFNGFTLAGKGLSILASADGEWRVGPSIITDIPGDAQVIVQGLGFARWLNRGFPLCREGGSNVDLTGVQAGLRVSSCSGVVTLEQCGANGGEGPGLLIEDSSTVLLHWFVARGGWRHSTLGAFPGIEIVRSHVDVSDCTFVGGPGPPGYCEGTFTCTFCEQGTNGGPGAFVGEGGTLRALDSEFDGGSGGQCNLCFKCDGASGIGLVASNGGSATLQSCTLSFGGWGTQLGYSLGPVNTVLTPRRALMAPTSVGPDGWVEFELQGSDGDLAFLLLSPTAGYYGLGLNDGVLLVGQPIPGGRRRVGQIDASGSLSVRVQLTAPLLHGTKAVYAQAAFIDSQGVHLSDARAIVHIGEDVPFLAATEVVHIAPSAATPGFGRSWDSAVVNLREASRRALHHAGAPSEYWFLEGRYVPGVVGSDPLTHQVTIQHGVSLRGGFGGHETSADQRTIAAHPTVFSGDLAGDDGPGATNRDDNASEFLRWTNVFSLCSALEIEVDGILFESFGRDIDPAARPLLLGPDTQILDCTFRANLGNDWQGIIGWWAGQGRELSATRTRWTSNRGHLWQRFTMTHLRDCVLVANSGAGELGLLAKFRPSSIVGCTLAGNQLTENTGTTLRQATQAQGARLVLRNSIFWNNSAQGAITQDAQFQLNPTPSAMHDIGWSCIEGWNGSIPGISISNIDPMFVDPLGPDGVPWTGDEVVELASGSTYIDAGDNDAIVMGYTTDIRGLPRRVDDPAAPDTGNGSAPLVDIGAFERQ